MDGIMSNPDRNDEWHKWNSKGPLWGKLKPLSREKRSEPTPAEIALWECVRNRKFEGLKFRRQHTIERFIVDFFCPELRLVIEVDGDIHQYTVEEDAVRQEFLESQGFQVIRFTNDQVLSNIHDVLNSISVYISQFSPPISPSPFAERGPGGEVNQ